MSDLICRAYVAGVVNDRQILGNLDGQRSFRSIRDYKRTNHYKALKSGTGRPKWSRIKYWQIEVYPTDQVIERIDNIHWSGE